MILRLYIFCGITFYGYLPQRLRLSFAYHSFLKIACKIKLFCVRAVSLNFVVPAPVADVVAVAIIAMPACCQACKD